MKITHVWATPVRPPARYEADASWLSESPVADPRPVDGYLAPSNAPGLGIDLDPEWLDA
ncbi:MAG TPA: hypothetical protein VHB98_23375 [Chloroflexota bacterium]|nr:hypothetical protein [Chloroflexota bacterium]